jgi:enoyl-[acyl-carrier protein] reductase II
MQGNNRITQLFGIEKPIIQAGMIWCSGWKLAAAVSKAGGLGVIGAGSMYPDVLKEHLTKLKASTSKPFAVNLPLLYPDIEKHVQSCIDFQVPIVITSAGSPKTWTKTLQEHGIIVVHVVSSSVFALKSQEAGVDAVIAEGFEAGGHNGREETTTICLIPKVRDVLHIPLIAAGGIGCGRSMLAAMALGADAVQIGSRFVASIESSASQAFKEKVLEAKEGDTKLMMKDITPVRLLKNEFYQKVESAENNCLTKEARLELLGRGRAKLGMFEGDMIEGELEIGQVSANFQELKPAAEIVEEIWNQFLEEKERLIRL